MERVEKRLMRNDLVKVERVEIPKSPQARRVKPRFLERGEGLPLTFFGTRF
jgi:hypothetical protein